MITILDSYKRDNDRQHVYFTLNNYGWSDGSVPADLEGEALQTYLEARKDIYKADIMQKHYPEHTPKQEMGETRLQAWQRFEKENPEKQRKEFVSNHPPELARKKALQKTIDGAKDFEGLKKVLQELV